MPALVAWQEGNHEEGAEGHDRRERSCYRASCSPRFPLVLIRLADGEAVPRAAVPRIQPDSCASPSVMYPHAHRRGIGAAPA